MNHSKLKIGILSTAHINVMGIILPVKKRQDTIIQAIASRSKEKGIAYQKRYQIPEVFDNYDALIDSPNIDAVYISLPNILHFQYIKKSLIAKKHVLCEKPITLSFDELKIVENLANENGVFLLDAIHYHYYPLMQTVMKDLVKYRDDIQYIESFLGFPLPKDGNIRLSNTLGGGAHNHLACYLTHFISWLYPQKKWNYKVFDNELYNGIDVLRSVRLTSTELNPLIYDMTVSFKNKKIDSWIELKWHDYFFRIIHAFTPTSFFDPIMPYKNIMKVITNHPDLSKKDYYFEGMKTTYDYQLDVFIKYVRNHQKQGVFLRAYEIFEKIAINDEA